MIIRCCQCFEECQQYFKTKASRNESIWSVLCSHSCHSWTHLFFLLILQGTNLTCWILWRVRTEETKEAVDPMLLMGKWFTFRLASRYGQHMWPLSCCVRALLSEGDMIKHHLRPSYRCTPMSLQQLHETDYCPSLLYSDRLFSTYMGSW